MHQPDIYLEVSISRQQLRLYNKLNVERVYSISSAKLGVGNEKDSYKTPLGWHKIRAKIGAGQAQGCVFKARRPTGEIFSSQLSSQFPDRDWILSRILWLSGMELYYNRLGNVDTMQRYIYIHGTAEHYQLGVPLSDGCIRMSNEDVIELFDIVPNYTLVNIVV